MNNELEALHVAVARLESAGIPYMLTGSVVSKEDLILSKLAWARDSESAQQLDDARKLLASGADEAYLREWSGKVGVEDLLRKCFDAGHGA